MNIGADSVWTLSWFFATFGNGARNGFIPNRLISSVFSQTPSTTFGPLSVTTTGDKASMPFDIVNRREARIALSFWARLKWEVVTASQGGLGRVKLEVRRVSDNMLVALGSGVPSPLNVTGLKDGHVYAQSAGPVQLSAGDILRVNWVFDVSSASAAVGDVVTVRFGHDPVNDRPGSVIEVSI